MLPLIGFSLGKVGNNSSEALRLHRSSPKFSLHHASRTKALRIAEIPGKEEAIPLPLFHVDVARGRC